MFEGGDFVFVDGFKLLVDTIQELPVLANQSHFVIVPSLQEPLLTNILPKYGFFGPNTFAKNQKCFFFVDRLCQVRFYNRFYANYQIVIWQRIRADYNIVLKK